MKQKWSSHKKAVHSLLQADKQRLEQEPDSKFLNTVYQDRLTKFEMCEG